MQSFMKPNTIVGIMGPKASGKSTLAYGFECEGYQTFAFADALRDACAASYGLDRDYFRALSTNQETKEKVCGSLYRKTPREVLREVGMYFRDHVHPDHWIRVLRTRVQAAQEEGVPVVVQDVRFPNEAAAIRDLGGIVLGVKREDAWRPGEDLAPSEAVQYEHWDRMVDLEVLNDGDIMDLHDLAQDLAQGCLGTHPQFGGTLLQRFEMSGFVTMRHGFDGAVWQILGCSPWTPTTDREFWVEECAPNPRHATVRRSELRSLQRVLSAG